MKFKNYKKILPKTPGIQGKDEYFNTSVLVLVTEISGEDYFVLQKRNINISQGGEICFPGGKIERVPAYHHEEYVKKNLHLFRNPKTKELPSSLSIKKHGYVKAAVRNGAIRWHIIGNEGGIDATKEAFKSYQNQIKDIFKAYPDVASYWYQPPGGAPVRKIVRFLRGKGRY